MILCNDKSVEFGLFPNGEPYLPKLHSISKNKRNRVTLKYESSADLFNLLLVREEVGDKAELLITYVPFSRMDRENNSYVFSLKTFAKFINDMHWAKVFIMEPHSDVAPALFDRVEVYDVTTSYRFLAAVNAAMGEPYQTCFPDVGAFKRYSEKLKSGTPLIGFKIRDFETGKIFTLDIQGEKWSDNVVIFDDLCSRGGTFVMAAERLQQMGFKRIMLAVAHCENTIHQGKLFDSPIEKVITTDSLLTNEDNKKLLVLRWITQ